MKRDFTSNLMCVSCRGSNWALDVGEETATEIREGTLRCESCDALHPINRGVVDFLDKSDEVIAREVAGWLQISGQLGDHLIPTMTALPYYPHDPWPQLAPDFFQIFEHVDFRGRKVIDIGAGRCWSTRFLATMGKAGQLVALDVLTTPFLGLETADIFFREDRVHFERIRGDLHRMPFPDGWADIVFSCAAVHHSSQLPRLCQEVARVLRPGGVFVFASEPSKAASVRENRPQNVESAAGINENLYSFEEYRHALRKAGFQLRRLVPRSIRYRLLYSDADFDINIPRFLRPFTKSERGRNAIEALFRNRLVGSLLYRYWSLPLTVIATRRG